MDKQLDIKKTECIIEALLFAVGDRVPLDTVAKVVGLDKSTTRSIICNMVFHYNNASKGLMIREINEGYQICTRPEIYDIIKVAFEPKNKQSLSQAAYEALSIIAYNGPVTKVKVEQIRGVNSDSAITKLIERSLVKEVGRMETPGKPMIYDVTEDFYRQFGYSGRADLPKLEMNEINSIDEVEEQ